MFNTIKQQPFMARLWRSLQKPHVQYSVALCSVAVILALIFGKLFIQGGMAHAAAGPTCASTQGTNTALCEKQDPTVQHCDLDAQSLKVLPVFYRGTLVGEVDLRTSATCKSYWIRTIAYGSAVQSTSNGPVINVEANITFTDLTTENATNPTPQLDRSLLTWTSMTTKIPSSTSGFLDLASGLSIRVNIGA